MIFRGDIPTGLSGPDGAWGTIDGCADPFRLPPAPAQPRRRRSAGRRSPSLS